MCRAEAGGQTQSRLPDVQCERMGMCPSQHSDVLSSLLSKLFLMVKGLGPAPPCHSTSRSKDRILGGRTEEETAQASDRQPRDDAWKWTKSAKVSGLPRLSPRQAGRGGGTQGMEQRNNFSGDKMLIHKPNRFLKYNVREVKTVSYSADPKRLYIHKIVCCSIEITGELPRHLPLFPGV